MLKAVLFVCLAHACMALSCPHQPSKRVLHQPPGQQQNSQVRLLKTKAAALKKYAIANGCDTQFCFLVDMSLPSGSNRFFVYHMQQDATVASGLVTHGYGNSSSTSVGFSNVPGSNSSSPGRYKIGAAYLGKFGLAYKLYGLDKTNSNAYQRFVVLHAHPCVPNTEVTPQSICMSQGCPTVSPLFLQVLKKYIAASNKPMLLWVF
jgi:hypothetical protein